MFVYLKQLWKKGHKNSDFLMCPKKYKRGILTLVEFNVSVLQMKLQVRSARILMPSLALNGKVICSETEKAPKAFQDDDLIVSIPLSLVLSELNM